jgi:hypothetical protein
MTGIDLSIKLTEFPLRHIKPGLRIFHIVFKVWGIILEDETYFNSQGHHVRVRYDYGGEEFANMELLSPLLDSNGDPVYVDELLIHFP